MNISFSKTKLEKDYLVLEEDIKQLAKELSSFRKESLFLLEEKINYYLK